MRMFAERSKQLLENTTNPNLGHETEIEVDWPHFKAFWLSKGHSTGHSERKIGEKVDRRRGGMTISRSGQGGNLIAQLGQLKTGLGGRLFCV